MLPEMDKIDWRKYQYGRHPPTYIPELIQKLTSHDLKIRRNAWHDLDQVLERAYSRGSDLPIVVIPLLIDLLGFLDLPEPQVITDLLIAFASYGDNEGLGEQMKQAVCQGINVYKSVQSNKSIEED